MNWLEVGLARGEKMKVIFLVGSIALLLSACSFHYSDGERSGVVTKFSKKGFFCKTWEGEMALGGFKSNGDGGDGGVVANLFHFTVLDEKLVPSVHEAMKSGNRVTLSYDQLILQPPCTADSSYLIKAVSN